MPYEKRILDMIKTGGASAEKRIYKFAKRRVRLFERSTARYLLCLRVGLSLLTRTGQGVNDHQARIVTEDLSDVAVRVIGIFLDGTVVVPRRLRQGGNTG